MCHSASVRSLLVASLIFAAVIPKCRAADPAQLDRILGKGSAEAWTVTPTAITISGEPALLASSPAGVTLSTKAGLTAPVEFVAAFRLKPVAGGSATATLQLARGNGPDQKPRSLAVSVGCAGGQTYVSYSTSVSGGKPPPAVSGAQHLVSVTERSLSWTEDLRRAVESQMAATAKPDDVPHRVRCTIEKGRFRTWLNGRFVGEMPLEADWDPSGTASISLTPNAELLLVRSRPLTAVPEKFEPLSIGGNLTGSTLQGKKVDRASLPGAVAGTTELDRTAAVDGVPFQFPAPAPDGNDHLDVGTSWTRFGALPGYIAANFGSFGGRWISADRLDPSRLCQYVPAGRYQTLHIC